MVVVVGKTPEAISVSRDQYLGLLSQLDAATHSNHPGASDLAYALLDTLRSWFQQGRVTSEIEGQLELPLEWAADRAAR